MSYAFLVFLNCCLARNTLSSRGNILLLQLLAVIIGNKISLGRRDMCCHLVIDTFKLQWCDSGFAIFIM